MSQDQQQNTNSTKDNKKWYSDSIKNILKKLNSDTSGLSEKEVEKRLKENGKNILPEKGGPSKAKIFFSQFKSSLVYVLLIAGVVSILLGDLVDGLIIFFAVAINVIIGFYQENKAITALSALKKIIVSYCNVYRDGQKKQIETKDIVVGDIVFLNSGDKVPADMRLIETKDLKINEAPLTGESMEVDKSNKKISGDLVLGDQINMAFMGTQVTQGEGMGVVVKAGGDTYLGHIANLVSEGEDVMTPLQKKLEQFSKQISIFVVLVCTGIFAIGILQKKDFTEVFITSIAIAVSAIPEGLLVAVTMILAVGMHRILKQKALAKNLLAAETLGSTSVICTDKTGTLTEGEMRVVELATHDSVTDFAKLYHTESAKKYSDELVFMLTIGSLCNNAYIENPDKDLEHRIIRGNPTEKALFIAADNIGIRKKDLDKKHSRLDEIPFDSEWKYMVTLSRDTKDTNKMYIKGAPDVLIEKSAYIFSPQNSGKKIKNTAKQKEAIMKQYEKMSKRGLRVIAVGYKTIDKSTKKIDRKTDDFVFVGLVGIKDPIRKGLKKILAQISNSGIRTVMITGDHEFTAMAIAKELGLKCEKNNVLNGGKLKDMNESDLVEVVDDITVYARVSPEDKLKIVKALQEKGEVVAMTGDGINDAPALNRASIGIAVGSGTDVSKETADLILLDDNFKTIISAIREGRVIYDNVKKVILYFLSNSMAEVIAVSLSLLFGWPLPLLAAQIIWINLVDDTLPSLALTQEPARKKIMQEKPRKTDEAIVNKEGIFLALVISILSAIFTLVIFKVYNINNSVDFSRTVSFTFLATSTLIYVFSIRDLKNPIWKTNIFSNKHLIGAIFISFMLQVSAVYIPFLQNIFHTESIYAKEWMLIISSCLVLVFLIEIIKHHYYKKK